MPDTWYAPREIYFNQSQMLWLIRNLAILKEGSYPKDFSSYIDASVGNKTRTTKAYFETPALYAAEVEVRLERAGIDGLILEAIEAWGKSESSIAAHLRIPEYLVKKKRDTALSYVSGWRRKRRTYWEHTSHKKAD